MNQNPPSKADLAMAWVCERCPVCNHARRKGAGFAFRFVSAMEVHICPFCRAYKRVHGRKAPDTSYSNL